LLCHETMYQLETKYYLIKHQFSPSEGWEITVDVDAMELAKGPQHKPDKKPKVEVAEKSLNELGVSFGAHEKYGRVDVAAYHSRYRLYLIEVEGKSSKQKEQAMYSALGQALLMMDKPLENTYYGIAVPDEKAWERQVQKVPDRVKQILNLKCFLVGKNGVRDI